MDKYYVNKNAQENRDHEVHKSGCSRMPEPENRLYLGEFATCHGAVAAAKRIYPEADGCYYCSPACHTS